MTWEPPVLLNDELNSQHITIRIDSRITHYTLSIRTEVSGAINYTSAGIQTSFIIELGNMSCSLSFQIAAVNSVGIGECSLPIFVDITIAMSIVHVFQQ